jgi:epoxyqueuosine reductase
MPSSLNTENQIKTWAQEMGFLACGFAKAERLNDHEAQLDQWLNNGFHGNMGYMENHKAMRLDPTLLVPGAKSVICLAYNYFPETTPLHQNNTTPQIAKYAWGDDYHHVIKDKLIKLIDRIKTLNPAFEARAFVDSAPVMERQWAERAGLGWIGKNSLLLRKGVGSFFFLAEIICNLELEPDQQQTDHCGECTACIDACPTQAIIQPQVIDSRRCISYLTIEDKTWPNDNDSIQKTYATGVVDPAINTGQWAYGCDVCQDVCPWNRFSQPNQEPRFAPREMISWNNSQWKEALSEPARIKPQLKKSAMQRAGLKKLIAQIDLALKYRPD